MKHRSWIKIAIVLALSIGLTGCGNVSKEEVEENGEKKQWNAPPEMKIDQRKTYEARFKTSKGDFTVELFDHEAPITVNSFVFLSRQGYYDGVTFHRIIESYMIQTGDPTGTGYGGPGYTIQDELDTPYAYEPGIVAMAKSSEPNSGGSQFFICTGQDSLGLNNMPNYTIFGRVTSGMETVLAIAKTPVTMGGESVPSKPTETVTIQTIEIVEK